MKKIGRTAFLVLLALGTHSVVAQQDKPKDAQPEDVEAIIVNPKAAKEIRKLLDLQGETPGNPQSEFQNIDRAIQAYKKLVPQVPETVWQDLTVVMKKEFTPDKLAEFLIPVYDQNFTPDEIRELTKFFSSPVGRKWSDRLPTIQRGSYNAGFVIGRLLGERLRERLRSLGYSIPSK